MSTMWLCTTASSRSGWRGAGGESVCMMGYALGWCFFLFFFLLGSIILHIFLLGRLVYFPLQGGSRSMVFFSVVFFFLHLQWGGALASQYIARWTLYLLNSLDMNLCFMTIPIRTLDVVLDLVLFPFLFLSFVLAFASLLSSLLSSYHMRSKTSVVSKKGTSNASSCE